MANEITEDKVKQHNEEIFAKLREGSLVKFERVQYTHWAVYIGERKVIHWSDEDGRMSIQTDALCDIVKGSVAQIGNDLDHIYNNIDEQQVVQVAKSITSDSENHPYSSEQFAKVCRYGQRTTNQVQTLSEETSTEEKSKKKSYIWNAITNITSTDAEIRTHNEDILKNIAVGDLIKVHRFRFYYHWAVYIGIDDSTGNFSVIHWSSDLNTLSKVSIRTDPFWEFAGQSKVENDNTLDYKYKYYDGDAVVRRAKSRQDAQQKNKTEHYNLFFNNCEHFAKWCRYGVNESSQSQELWGIIKEPLLDIGRGVLDSFVGLLGCVQVETEEREQNERMIKPMTPYFSNTRNEVAESVVGTLSAGAVEETVKGEQEEETNLLQVPDRK